MLLTSASASGITINPGAKVTLNGSQITTQDIEVKPGGSLEANSGAMSLFGNWQNQGTLTSGTSTIIFLGSNSSTISNTNTFYNLTCTTPGKQLNFTAGQKQTITNKLTLTGALNNLILLRSTIPTNQWDIDPQGERSVDYLDVQDSENINPTVIAVPHSKNSGNNVNWSFPGAIISVSIAEDALSLGSVAAGSTTISQSAVNVINNSDGVNETYSLSVTNPSGWTASQSAAGAETYVLDAVFDADGTGITWSEANQALSTTAVASSATKFAGDQAGVNVPYNATRKLWFQFKAPTSTTVNTEQSIVVTITAQAG